LETFLVDVEVAAEAGEADKENATQPGHADAHTFKVTIRWLFRDECERHFG
jgi:hypothetical protein